MWKRLMMGALVTAALGAPSLASAAATYVVGAPITAKVTHSSTGSACDSSCWEIWRIAGIGSFMVVKDDEGYISNAGLTQYDQELTSLYTAAFTAALTDRETGVYGGTGDGGLKLPTSPAVYRYGVVTTTTNAVACSTNCSLGAFFGVPVVFVLNSLAAADFVVDEPALTPQPLGDTYTTCPVGEPRSCTRITQQGGAPGTDWVVITIVYDENGDVEEIIVERNGVVDVHWKKT